MGDDLHYCECCGYGRIALPYRHDRPDAGGVYDYCQQCWNIGCDGPNYCDVGEEDAHDDLVPVDAADMAYVYESLGITPRDPEEETQ